MNKLLLQVCLAQAGVIVKRYRDSVPEGAEFYNGTVGSSSGDSRMERHGTTTASRASSLPSFLSNILTDTINNAAVPGEMSQQANSFLSGLLTRDNSNLPGSEYTKAGLAGLDPTSFAGRDSLTTIANRDAFSPEYEQATNAKYEDLVQQGLAQVQTGPDVVRSGTARTALTQGEAVDSMARNRAQELRAAQTNDAQLSMKAAEILNAVESGRRGLLIQGGDNAVKELLAGASQGLQAATTTGAKNSELSNLIGLGARALGTDSSTTVEDLAGWGSQSSSGHNLGLNCCFIFIEGLRGKLPWFVRRARDIFYEECPARRDGYVRMAKWLVPAMRRWTWVRRAVEVFMINPCVKYGAWMFGDESAKSRWRLYGPVVSGWFKVWQLYGKV